MLGGILGGLANLGTIYGGYQAGQLRDLQTQLDQQKLQALQAQQMSWPDLLSVDQSKLMGGPTAQFQPSPTAGVPSAPSAPTPLTGPAYQAPPSAGPAPAPLPQSPLLQASAGPLGQAGIPGGGPLGLPGLPGMSAFGGGAPSASQPQLTGADAIFGPGTSAFGTPTSVPSQQAQRGLPTLPLSGPQYAMTGPQPGADVYTGTMSFEPTQYGQRTGQPPGQQPPNLNGLGKQAQPAPSSGILQPPGSFGLPPGYAPQPAPRPGVQPSGTAGPDFDQPTSGQAPQQTAQAPGTRDTGGTAQVPGTADTGGMAYVGTGAGGPNNPGNIKTVDGGWQKFNSPQEGTAAIGDWLVRAQTQHGATTVRQIIDRYAPPSDPGNAGKNLPEAAARIVGVGPDDPIDMRDPATRQKMVRAIAAQEGARPAGDAITNAVMTSRQIVNASTSPQEKQAISIGNMSILQRYPFLGQMTGTMDIHYLANLIEQNHPGASAAVKMGIFTNMFNLLQPLAKERFAETIDLVKTDIAEQQRAATQEETAWYHRQLLQKPEGQNWQLVETGDPANPIARVQTSTGQVEPVQLGAGAHKLGSKAPDAEGVGNYQVFTDPANGQQYMMRPGDPSSAKDIEGNRYKPGGAQRIGGASQGSPLTDATAERYAKIFAETGYLPPGIARNSKAIAQIMNKTGDTGSPGDFIANIASRQADTKSLANMQKIADAAVIYENTAIRNFDQALKYADKGIPTNMGPWINRWVATGQTEFGGENVPPYVTALLTAANEYAKVMSGSTGAAGATEGARQEAAQFFNPYFNQGQIKEVITVAKQEMENRKEELYSGIDDIKNRLRSPGSAQTPRGHEASDRGAASRTEKSIEKAKELTAGGPSAAEIAKMTQDQLYALKDQKLTKEQEDAVRARAKELGF